MSAYASSGLKVSVSISGVGDITPWIFITAILFPKGFPEAKRDAKSSRRIMPIPRKIPMKNLQLSLFLCLEFFMMTIKYRSG